MRAIIIGAGRGKRLMPTTDETPKCFAEVQGRRIIDWNLQSFAENGITEICFIGGYRIEKVKWEYPHFIFRENRDWSNNNIMVSLMHAEDLMNVPFVCSYSDCLFSAGVVGSVLKSSAEIALSVETDWLARYARRSDHPTDDAEKVSTQNGLITRIHREMENENAHGEYTGIAKFSANGARRLIYHYHRCRQAYSGRSFREAPVLEKAYLIHLFQEMIEAGETLAYCDHRGGYVEIDTQQDYRLAELHWGKS